MRNLHANLKGGRFGSCSGLGSTSRGYGAAATMQTGRGASHTNLVGVSRPDVEMNHILALDLLLLKPVLKRMSSCVLFAWFEQCVVQNNVRVQPLARWLIDGLVNKDEFREAFRTFGYHYRCRSQYTEVRMAQREFIHPVTRDFLLYLLVTDHRTGLTTAVRNSITIESRFGRLPPLTLNFTSPRQAARDAIRLSLDSYPSLSKCEE
jgi:hypothetical protein